MSGAVASDLPGLVDTYFNDSHPGGPETDKTHLLPLDVAQAVRYVLEAPAHMVVAELMLRQLTQEY